jgi:MFS family permease
MFLEKISDKLKSSFHALSHQNFRIFWFGQIISLIGSWMQTISQPWLAYKITNSPFLLSIVGALQFLPMLIFSLFIGALLDRFDKKKIIILTQSTLAVLALILSFLVFTKQIQYWHILIIALLQGFANAIDMPSRQSFMIQLLGKKDLMNGIALNSAIFNGARIVGPAVAGILMAKAGIEYCFFINAISFIPVIIGLFFIQPIIISDPVKSQNNILTDILNGLKYIFHDTTLLKTIISVTIVGTFVMNFNVFVPVFAKTVLKQDEAGFGYLMSSMGIGSLLGALIMAAKSKNGPKNIFLTGSAFLVSIVFIIIGLNSNYILTAVFLAIAGCLTVSFMTTANSTIQLNSSDEFRSRVISVYFLVNAGSTPIGNLIVGGLSDLFGIGLCFIIIGLIVFILILALFFISNNDKKKNQLNKNFSNESIESK